MTTVTLRQTGPVAVVEFANGSANYFTPELLHAIADLMEEARATGSRAVVLSSVGRHFCAGADFSVIGPSAEERGDVADRSYAAGLRIFQQPLPVVAAIQGAAIGGGMGLACAADFRVVTPETRLEANFTRLGFHPGFGLSVVLPRIVGHQQALVLLMESRRVRGVQAVEIGLAERVVEVDSLVDAAVEMAGRVAERAPLAVQAVRATLRRSLVEEVAIALRREAAEQRRLWETEDAEIGIEAAQLRRAPRFVGR